MKYSIFYYSNKSLKIAICVASIVSISYLFVFSSVKRIESEFKILLNEASVRLKKVENQLFEQSRQTEHKTILNIFDLTKEPTNLTFECVKSALIIVQTTICIHDVSKDVFVSGSIRSSGAWEQGLVFMFMRLLNLNKDFHVLDIGAQLGQYTLFAAKLGRTCVAVEPFYDNYIRLHASAHKENLTDRIILVNNGISDKRGQKKRLRHMGRNIGGQGITDDPLGANQTTDDKYALVTIEMDDLLEIVPPYFQNAIMKIDIEGYEFKAFRRASRLLKQVNVPVIFMEWLGKENVKEFPDHQVNEFLNYMNSSGYTCRKIEANFEELQWKDVRKWPGDVVWTKRDKFEAMVKP